MKGKWNDVDGVLGEFFGKRVTLVRTLEVTGRVCSHSEGGCCVQDEFSSACYKLEDGDDLEVREPDLLVAVREGITHYVRTNGSSLTSLQRENIAQSVFNLLKDNYGPRPTAG